eukprot:m51a1_g14339 hypothetical protein (272) ;mRNA; f:159193-160008
MGDQRPHGDNTRSGAAPGDAESGADEREHRENASQPTAREAARLRREALAGDPADPVPLSAAHANRTRRSLMRVVASPEIPESSSPALQTSSPVSARRHTATGSCSRPAVPAAPEGASEVPLGAATLGEHSRGRSHESIGGSGAADSPQRTRSASRSSSRGPGAGDDEGQRAPLRLMTLDEAEAILLQPVRRRASSVTRSSPLLDEGGSGGSGTGSPARSPPPRAQSFTRSPAAVSRAPSAEPVGMRLPVWHSRNASTGDIRSVPAGDAGQ